MNAVLDFAIIVDPAEDGYWFSIFFEPMIDHFLVVPMGEKTSTINLKFQVDCFRVSFDLDEQVRECFPDMDQAFDPQIFVTIYRATA